MNQGLNGKLILTTETVNLFFSFLLSFDLNYFDMNKPRLVWALVKLQQKNSDWHNLVN